MKKNLLLSILFLFICHSVFACECNGYPYTNGKSPSQLWIEDSFKSTNTVFYGKYLGDWKFQVIKQYKGSKTKIIELTSMQSLCDYYFKDNQKYLVYGLIDEKGYLWTDTCLPNSLIERRKDLKSSTQYFTN